MARYPLEPLLRARMYREEKAARETRAAARRLEEAGQAVERARKAVADFRAWRPGEEERLFAAVRGRVLPQRVLEQHREDILALGLKELALEEELLAAKKTVAHCEAELEEAKRMQAAALRDRQKIDIHRDIWTAEEAKRAEAAEESELEDFAGKSGEDMFDMEETG